MLGVQDGSAVVPAQERTANRGLQEQLRREKSTTAQLQEELQVCVCDMHKCICLTLYTEININH